MGYFLSFFKFLERKNGLEIEKIKLTAGQARKTRCYHPQAPFGVAADGGKIWKKNDEF